ncbi:MAG TPA: GTPase ObgE [Kiritimatiellia bacterium]|nr:GTPase ObgE [Kiritimatiellia bacterium]
MKGVTFVDRVRAQVFAGNGGDGCASFRREKYIPLGGPDGGDGGDGGSIYMRGSHDAGSLLDLYYQPLRRAEHGGNGRSKQCTGRNGEDVYIDVPCGTVVRDFETGELIGEVLEKHDVLLVARGGRGGMGNMKFTSSTNRAPREFTHGTPGEIKKLLVELKTVADIGLVGYPNAGKSTLLAAVSRARPKIAAYPFTTLHPSIGTIDFGDFSTLRMADIPGLIDGAHKGVGLGHDFLRHIERTKFLLFVIDMAGVDGRNPVEDYRNLKKELKLYSKELAQRPFMVVANKMDLPEAAPQLKDFIRRTKVRPLQLAAAAGTGIAELKQMLRDRLSPTP